MHRHAVALRDLHIPIMVGIVDVIAGLDALQTPNHLVLIHVQLFNQARLLEHVVAEHGQSLPRSGISKLENVKLPVALGILQQPTICSRCDSQVTVFDVIKCQEYNNEYSNMTIGGM